MLNTSLCELLIGYAYSVLVGALIIGWFGEVAWKAIGENQGHRLPNRWTTHEVGVLERLMYTTAFLWGFPGFIALWLVLKAASAWKKWEGDPDVRGKKRKTRELYWGRARFNLWQISTGLSLAYAFVGAQITKWLIEDRWTTAIVAGVILLALTLVFTGIAAIYGESPD